MYKLYGCAGTGSAAPQALLAEVGADHEMVMLDLDKEEHRTPEHLAMNPRGQVPWLVVDDGVITESSAIMLHIGDRHPETGVLAAPGSIERAHAYRWMAFLATNVYESVLRGEYSQRYTTSTTDAGGVKAAAHRDVDRWWGIVDEALGAGPLLFGERLSVPDIYLAMLVCWHHEPAALRASRANVGRALDTVLARTRVRAVFEQNGLV